MTEKTYALTARQLDMVIQCLARAETEGAFKDCVVPRIGRSTLAMLEGLRAETQEDQERIRTAYYTAEFEQNRAARGA
jgi:hypothetical protein